MLNDLHQSLSVVTMSLHSDLKFPLPGAWTIVSDATKVVNIRRKYPRCMWTEQIFQGPDDTASNVDGLRRYCKVTPGCIRALVPFLRGLEAVKESSHVIGGHALIRSFDGCGKQASHTDYFTMESKGAVKKDTMPYSCVVVVEGGSSLYLKEEKISLPAGSAIVFRGDVVHSGSEYSRDNIRYHLYMYVDKKHEASDGAYVKWVRTT